MQTRLSMRQRILAAAGGCALVLGVGIAQGGALEALPEMPGQDGGVETPEEYAGAAFSAWVEGNQEELQQRAQPAVAEFLAIRGPGTVAPGPEPVCEEVSTNTFCTWLLADEDIQLELRVDGQAASDGHPGAVVEAAFKTSPSGVAIWPLTTQEEADNTQQSVDEGHSPWMLEPEAVITAYASAELGWDEGIVDVVLGEPEGGPFPYLVTNTSTGLVLNVEVDQPARSGDDGIWAVTRAGASASFEPTDPSPATTAPPTSVPATTVPGPVPAPPAPPVPATPPFTG